MTLEERIFVILEKHKGEKLTCEEISAELEKTERFLKATLGKLAITGNIKRDKRYNEEKRYAQWRYYL